MQNYDGIQVKAAILQTAFSNALSWMKIVVFCFEFHWNVCSKAQIRSLVVVMVWRRTCDKPLCEPVMAPFNGAYAIDVVSSLFLPEASFGLRVLSLPACVCVCVCVRVSVRQSSACPCNNSSTVQARITKFGPEMEKTLVKIPIILWDDWPWTSRSNRT